MAAALKETAARALVFPVLNRNSNWLILPLLLMLATGCTPVKKRFTSTQIADISVFADNTIALLADSDFGLQKDNLVVTREYYDYTGAASVKLIEKGENIQRIFTNIVDYSIGIVTLAESDRTDAEKVAIFADRLEQLRSRALRKTSLTDETFSEMIARIRSQEKLLGAFQEAQPLINAGVRYAASVLFEMDRLATEITRNMESRIDADYAYAIDFVDHLQEQKLEVLNALELLYRIQAGDGNAIETLRQNPWIRSKEVLSNDSLDGSDIYVLEEELLNHLGTLNQIYWGLSDEVDTYHAAHNELDKVYTKVLQENAKARLALVIWARAHQKMASGTLDSAKWFDISETPGLLLRVGSKALL